ncbi:hypothetical protein [Cohnella lupini]|uniref:PilX-like prepilin protein n=1 Tax=Cohnella lupini TaxID=1294267 RepID=A0A3D9IIZ5_9BACL|nr:hypothetical protein [Cohnella lupini]RED61708.1 hypothetical protein DFP95_105137 [Cohnella lupini]
MLREERGSALLLVLFMLFIFTMLGLAVMSASIGGAHRSVAREKDVQSLHLAEKTLTEAVAYIAANYNKRDDITLEQLQEDIEEIQADIEGKTVVSKLNLVSGREAKGIITGVEMMPSQDGQEYVIRLSAEADVDGVIRKLVQDININAYPDFLKYTMGSEADLKLNGAPYFLNGDVYAGVNLRVKNEAEYKYYGSSSTTPTLFPTIAGNIVVEDISRISYCDKTISSCSAYQALNKNDADIQTKVHDILGIALDNLQLKDNKAFVEVNIRESFLDKVMEAVGAKLADRNIYKNEFQAGSGKLIDYLSDNTNINKLGAPRREDFEDDEDGTSDYLDQVSAYIDSLNSEHAASVLHMGNLKLDGKEFKRVKYTVSAKNDRTGSGNGADKAYKSNWFIVNGDFEIDNEIDAPLELRGNILVTGNLKIKGNTSIDATIFALGSTTIEDATIKGMKDGAAAAKELVLLSSGPINIHRVDSFNRISSPYPDQTSINPIIMDAFFYTDQDATLYGVGSAFWIRGGFFAKGNLTINAVTGNAEPDRSDPNHPMIDFVGHSNPKMSRFIIEYNPSIYYNQKVGLPRVKQINLSIGKKRLQTID